MSLIRTLDKLSLEVLLRDFSTPKLLEYHSLVDKNLLERSVEYEILVNTSTSPDEFMMMMLVASWAIRMVIPQRVAEIALRMGISEYSAIKILADDFLSHHLLYLIDSPSEIDETEVKNIYESFDNKLISIGEFNPTSSELLECVTNSELSAGYVKIVKCKIPPGYGITIIHEQVILTTLSPDINFQAMGARIWCPK